MYRKQAQILVYIACAIITVLCEQRMMCLGMQRHTHITLCNRVTVYPPLTSYYSSQPNLETENNSASITTQMYIV